MKTILSCAVLCFLLNVVNAQSGKKTIPIQFQKRLDEAKMNFVKPDSVIETPVKETGKLPYDYALKLNNKNIEIRYSVRPLPKGFFDSYENRQKKDGDTILNPNTIHKILTPRMYSMISGGKLTDQQVLIKYFKPERIKASAGADVGSMSTGPIDSDWAQGYSFGFYVMLHKDYVADAYIYYLFENEKQMVDTFGEITSNEGLFYALKFK